MKKIFTIFLLMAGIGPGLMAQMDCRVKPADMQPLIAHFNPFFTDHRWEDHKKMETARLDQDRLLIITQNGCKRHHTTFLLILSPQCITNTDSFWIAETKSMIYATFFENPVYTIFQKPFEEAFEEKFSIYGLNDRFNFPIGTRNFVCEIKYDPVRGANIRVEMVQFIFQEAIQTRKSGIPREQDDGWFQPKAN